MPSVLYCQQCSLLPTLSSTVSTAAASATRNAWTSNFSSIARPLSSVLYHPSSVVRRLSSVVCRPDIRSSSFRDFFTQKYSALNSLPRRRHQVSPGSKPLPSRVRAPLVLEHQGRGSSTTIFSLPGDWAEFLSEMRVNGSTAGNRCLRNTISFAKSMPTLTIST